MPEIDEPARRPSTSVKVVVTGPYGVGTTTMIRTLSEINVLTTERRILSLDDTSTDTPTMVSMDFGRLTIDDELQLYLFGTPGQQRLDFMWEILAEGLLGFVIMVDHSRADSFDEAMDVVAYFRDRGDVPYIVAVNKIPAGEEDHAVSRARHTLRIDDHVRVVSTDVRNRDRAKGLLLELFHAARDHAALAPAAGTADQPVQTEG
ncbi:ATP/GTP-binding protein [soil metagenome]